MQKITPCLLYQKEARKTAEFYQSVFGNGTIRSVSTIENTPSGSVEIVSLEIHSQVFTLFSAGPLYKFTPAVSFFVACDSKAEVDDLWDKLSARGTALMELGEYPFSERYGWVQDKFGLSWQVMYMGALKATHKITPTFMFVNDNCGKAEEAISFYTSVFKDSTVRDKVRYNENEAPDKPGTIKWAGFTLEGQSFAAMDSAHKHNFTFNEAHSFVINCQTQDEIDYYWGKLSADPASEQCGWLKDKYGLSWQVVPTILWKMLTDKDSAKVDRVTQALQQMKKYNITALQKAYEG